MKLVYMCHTGLKKGGGGLGRGPSLKKGGFQSGPSREKIGDFGAKNGGGGGFCAAHTRTVLIWEYSPPPPTPGLNDVSVTLYTALRKVSFLFVFVNHPYQVG